jgi:hypothetical protein
MSVRELRDQGLGAVPAAVAGVRARATRRGLRTLPARPPVDRQAHEAAAEEWEGARLGNRIRLDADAEEGKVDVRR